MASLHHFSHTLIKKLALLPLYVESMASAKNGDSKINVFIIF
jgi:hypothetical protein